MRIMCSVLLLSSLAFAGPKRTIREFDVSCPRLWNAAKIAVKANYDVLSLDDHEMSGSFTTGNAFSAVRPLAFDLSGTGGSCTIAVTGHFSGLIHNDKGSFFDRVQGALRDVPQDEAKKPAVSPIAQVVAKPIATNDAAELCKRETLRRQPNAKDYFPEVHQVGDSADSLRIRIDWKIPYGDASGGAVMVSDCRIAKVKSSLHLQSATFTFP